MQGSLVLTAIRNEGPYLLEWIAWHKMLGFENILVLFNDCTDHSPQLLRLLDRSGEIVSKKHEPRPGHFPKPECYRVARQHPLVKQAKWMLTIDVDEFLVVHVGDRTIGALLNDGDVPFASMAINWRLFGGAYEKTWKDSLVHRRFDKSSEVGYFRNTPIKSLVRDPRLYNPLNSHCVSGWSGEGTWGEDGNYCALTDGSRFDEYHPNKRPQNRVPEDRMLHHVAEINHYAVRTEEEFDYKKGRPAPADGADRYTEQFRRILNRNDEENLSAISYGDRFDAEYDRLCQIPGVLRLHHLCCADFIVSMCEKRGDDPKADPRFKYHKDMAKSLPRHG